MVIGWGAAHEEVAPVLKATHEGKQFTIVDVIVPFRIQERLGVVSHCNMLVVAIYLSENSASGIGGCVNLEKEGFGGIRLLEMGV